MTRGPGTRRLLLAAVAAALLLGWLGWPDDRLPDARFVLIDGRQLHSDELRGAPLLINFWATSCRSCLQEIPDLVRLHRDYVERGLTVIGVAMPYDAPDRVVDFARRRQLPYAIALDIDGQLVKAFDDVRLTPTHILVAADGRIVARHSGPLDAARTRRHIEQLLEES